MLLFGFLVAGVLAAVLAELVHFQARLQSLLVLAREIIDRLAFGALQLDHVILAHMLCFD